MQSRADMVKTQTELGGCVATQLDLNSLSELAPSRFSQPGKPCGYRHFFWNQLLAAFSFVKGRPKTLESTTVDPIAVAFEVPFHLTAPHIIGLQNFLCRHRPPAVLIL
jgi:hypothetical protein